MNFFLQKAFVVLLALSFSSQLFADATLDTIPYDSIFVMKSKLNNKYLTVGEDDKTIFATADEISIKTAFKLVISEDPGKFHIQSVYLGGYNFKNYGSKDKIDLTTGTGSATVWTNSYNVSKEVSFDKDDAYMQVFTDNVNLNIGGTSVEDATLFVWEVIPSDYFEIEVKDTVVLDYTKHFALKSKVSGKYMTCYRGDNDSIIFATADDISTKAEAFLFVDAGDNAIAPHTFHIENYNGDNLKYFKNADGFDEFVRPLEPASDSYGNLTQFYGAYYVDAVNNEIKLEVGSGVGQYLQFNFADSTLAAYGKTDSAAAVFILEYIEDAVYNALPDPVGIPTQLFEQTGVNTISIYPNPADDFIYVSTKDLGVETLCFSIYDLAGQLCKETSSSSKIRVSDLPSGLYVLHISSDNAFVATQKIVVQ